MNRKKIYLLTLSFYLLLSVHSFAADDNSIWSDIKSDAALSFNSGVGLIKSPFTASESDWLRILYAGAGTGTLFLIDPEIKDIAHSNRNKTNNWLFGTDAYINRYSVGFSTYGMYVAGLIFRKPALRRTGLYAMESVIVASSITAMLKIVFGRSRPYLNEGATKFRVFDGNPERYRSLPSGHTTTAFALGTVLAKSIDNIWWKIFWYGGGAMVGFSRIYHDRHWLSDTALAGFIGYATANYFVNFDERTTDNKEKLKEYSFQPYFSLNTIGIRVNF